MTIKFELIIFQKSGIARSAKLIRHVITKNGSKDKIIIARLPPNMKDEKDSSISRETNKYFVDAKLEVQ